MDNKDLIKQYADTGQEIGKYQFDRLPDNIKVTYLRKRIIAATQYEDDELINSYEILGVPESYRSEMVNYLLSKMRPYFNDINYEVSDIDGEDYNYSYGNINPILKKILKSNTWDSRIDDIVISLSQDKNFIKYLNKSTLNKIMSNVVNPSKVFSHLGSIGEKFKNDKTKNSEKTGEDIIYSNSPLALIEFLGKEPLISYFNNMKPNIKAYKLSNSNNPKAMLPILGYDTMDYIKQAIANGENNLVNHLLNNANNNYEMEKIFDEYGIEHGHVNKYYDRRS